MTWPWKRFVVAISLVGLCLVLVGARDLSEAWQDGTSARAAAETIVAGMLCIGVVVCAVMLKNRGSRRKETSYRPASNTSDVAPTPELPGQTVSGPNPRDRCDDRIDEELSRL